MPDLTAKRTLVKSPPELWEELSEVERLAKHLGAFGEIKTTKLEPEHTVAWEGEHASGTVSIEPSGWGTKVTLHAELPEEPAAAEPEPAAEEPVPVADEPTAEVAHEFGAEHPIDAPVVEQQRRGVWAWLFRQRTAPPEAVPMPALDAVTVEEEEPAPVEEEPAPVEEEPAPVEPEAVAVDEEPVAPEPQAVEPDDLDAAGHEPIAPLDPQRVLSVLDEALDALGAAHHRPFSRG